MPGGQHAVGQPQYMNCSSHPAVVMWRHSSFLLQWVPDLSWPGNLHLLGCCRDWSCLSWLSPAKHNLTCVWLSSSPPSTFLTLHFISFSVCCCCLCAFLDHQVPAGVTAASPPPWLYSFFWLKLHFWGQGLWFHFDSAGGQITCKSLEEFTGHQQTAHCLAGWVFCISLQLVFVNQFVSEVRPHQNMQRLDLTEGRCQFPLEWRLHPWFSTACPVLLYEYALHDSFSSPEHLGLTEVLSWTSCVLELWCRLNFSSWFF